MFLLIVFLGSGVAAESSTCDDSYSEKSGACAYQNFGCYNVALAQQDIPTCFNGLAQSPINLNSSSATAPDEDPGQLTFSGYNKELQQTPLLRLKEFTVQLDFNQQSQMQRMKRGKKKKGKRKNRRRKNDSLKRSSRQEDVSLPSISGGVLGDNT